LQRTTKQRRAVSKAKVSSNALSSNSGSQSSVNNDWGNWLVLHSKEKARSDDVINIGKAVGLKFEGDKNNMFDVLSGGGSKNNNGGGKGV